jgi:hypothetical protein
MDLAPNSTKSMECLKGYSAKAGFVPTREVEWKLPTFVTHYTTYRFVLFFPDAWDARRGRSRRRAACRQRLHTDMAASSEGTVGEWWGSGGGTQRAGAGSGDEQEKRQIPAARGIRNQPTAHCGHDGTQDPSTPLNSIFLWAASTHRWASNGGRAEVSHGGRKCGEGPCMRRGGALASIHASPLASCRRTTPRTTLRPGSALSWRRIGC